MDNRSSPPFALWLIWASLIALAVFYARDVAANLVWIKGAPAAWWVFVAAVVAAVTGGAITSTYTWWRHHRSD